MFWARGFSKQVGRNSKNSVESEKNEGEENRERNFFEENHKSAKENKFLELIRSLRSLTPPCPLFLHPWFSRAVTLYILNFYFTLLGVHNDLAKIRFSKEL